MFDCRYIPRVLFLTPEGQVMTDMKNEGGSDQYKYYYHSPSDIVNTMKRVIGQKSQAQKDDL